MGESADQGRNGGAVRTDPTFYRSAAEAVAAPTEKLAYVVAFDRAGQQHDALTVVDVDAASDELRQVVGWADLPDPRRRAAPLRLERLLERADARRARHGPGRAAAALPAAARPAQLARPRLRHPARPARAPAAQDDRGGGAGGQGRLLPPAHAALRPGRGLPHLPRRPDGVEGPGGIALLDHTTFDVLRAWETDRGPQCLAYDAWWHLNQNTLISSEWGSPPMIEDGLVPELLLGQQVRPPPALLGPGDGPAHPERRPRRRAPDGARDPALPRPRRDVGVRRGGHLDRRPVRVGVALAPRGRRLEGRQGHHHPGRAGGPGRPAAGAAAVRCRPAAGHRHRPVRRRPDALRLLLGHRRAQAVRRVRPRRSRARSGPSSWAGSSGAPPTRRPRPSRSPAARRWWRSAATAVAST